MSVSPPILGGIVRTWQSITVYRDDESKTIYDVDLAGEISAGWSTEPTKAGSTKPEPVKAIATPRAK